MKPDRQRSAALYNLVQCLYWIGGCAVISFSVVYLTEKGFSPSASGLICSAAAALSFLLTTVASSAIDAGRARSATAGQTLLTGAALSLVCSFFARRPGLLAAASYSLAMAALQASVFFYNKLYTDLRRGGVPLDFGLARGLGSLAFSAASALLGLAVRAHGARGLPALACLLIAAQCVCVFLLCRPLSPHRPEATAAAGTGLPLGRFLSRYRRFSCFLLGAGVISAINLTVTTFLIRIVERAGGTASTLGYLNAYMAMIEIPVMFLYTRIRKRLSPEKLVLIGLAFFCVKTLGFTFAVSRPLLFAAATMHAFSFGLFTPASVDYVLDTIPQSDSAKGQGLMAMTPTLLSCVTLAAFGLLLNIGTLFSVLCLCAVLSLLGLLLCIRSL